jgi:LmbE family N-acetylglucosaminyl deacetylase
VSVLAVGAHPDDMELGCGGALLAMKARGATTTMIVMTDGASNGTAAVRRKEARAAARLLGATPILLGYPDGGLTLSRQSIHSVEKVIRERGVTTVFVHAPEDTHQDHRATTEIVLAAARRVPSVLFYQSPSTTRFEPTVFVDIAKHIDDKVAALECHDSQVRGSLMVEPDVLPAMSRYWGVQSRLGEAEGFMPLRVEL